MKPLRFGIQNDNKHYRVIYEKTLAELDRCDRFDLRNRLAHFEHTPYSVSLEAIVDAIVTKLICKNDAPKLIDSTGYRWA